MAVSKHRYMFTFIRNFQMVVPSSFTILHPHHQCIRAPVDILGDSSHGQSYLLALLHCLEPSVYCWVEVMRVDVFTWFLMLRGKAFLFCTTKYLWWQFFMCALCQTEEILIPNLLWGTSLITNTAGFGEMLFLHLLILYMVPLVWFLNRNPLIFKC